MGYRNLGVLAPPGMSYPILIQTAQGLYMAGAVEVQDEGKPLEAMSNPVYIPVGFRIQ